MLDTEQLDLVDVYNSAKKHYQETHDASDLIKFYNNFELYEKNKYPIEYYYKMESALLNLDKTEQLSECWGVYTKHKKENKQKVEQFYKELLLKNSLFLEGQASEIETELLNVFCNTLISQADMSSNSELSYINKMIAGMKATLKNPMGKYSLKFIHSNAQGQTSFFAEEDIVKLPVKGVCSRNITKTDEILWDGNSALLKNVRFLFHNFNESKCILDFANKGSYYTYIYSLLTSDQKKEFDEIQCEIKEALTKNNESTSIPKNGVPSIYFPVDDNKYILLTPIISGDMQIALNNKVKGNKKNLSRGGANPQNGGWLSKKLNGRHVHFNSDIPETIMRNGHRYENGSPLFYNLKIPNKKEYYKDFHEINIQINNIVIPLSEIENEQSISNRNANRLSRLSYVFALKVLEDLALFIQNYDYNIDDEKPKLMHDDVFTAIALYNINSFAFEDFIITKLLGNMHLALQSEYAKNKFILSVKEAMKELF